MKIATRAYSISLLCHDVKEGYQSKKSKESYVFQAEFWFPTRIRQQNIRRWIFGSKHCPFVCGLYVTNATRAHLSDVTDKDK